jgi:hypothetical protein
VDAGDSQAWRVWNTSEVSPTRQRVWADEMFMTCLDAERM